MQIGDRGGALGVRRDGVAVCTCSQVLTGQVAVETATVNSRGPRTR